MVPAPSSPVVCERNGDNATKPQQHRLWAKGMMGWLPDAIEVNSGSL